MGAMERRLKYAPHMERLTSEEGFSPWENTGHRSQANAWLAAVTEWTRWIGTSVG